MKQIVETAQEPTPSWDLVQPSLRLVYKHIDQVIFLFLLPAALFALGSLLIGDTSHIKHLSDITVRQRYGIAAFAVGSVWSLVNMAPSLYFRLRAAQGITDNLSQTYRQGLHYFWRLAGLYMLFGLSIVAGLMLLIVPGLIAGFVIINRYYLAPYYIADRGLSIREALAASRLETMTMRGWVWSIVAVQLVFGLAGGLLASALPPFGALGSLFTGVICLFLPALRYLEVVRLFHGSVQPPEKN